MSYTSKDLVEKQINLNGLPGGVQRDYPVIFTGWEEVSLPGHSIVEGSVIVKAPGSAEPTRENIILESGSVALGHDRLVPNSITVASDSSLGIIYVENSDYSIDYVNGKVTRINGGNIVSGSDIVIWYYYYSRYTEGADYSVGYQSGTIKRVSGSAIQPGQLILIDYQLLESQLNDAIIVEAVNQANAIVESEIDKEQTFGADPVLQAAATCLAVSLLCRIEGSGCLRAGGAGEKDVKSWLALAESYRSDFDRLIKKFRPGAAHLNHPTYS